MGTLSGPRSNASDLHGYGQVAHLTRARILEDDHMKRLELRLEPVRPEGETYVTEAEADAYLRERKVERVMDDWREAVLNGDVPCKNETVH